MARAERNDDAFAHMLRSSLRGQDESEAIAAANQAAARIADKLAGLRREHRDQVRKGRSKQTTSSAK